MARMPLSVIRSAEVFAGGDTAEVMRTVGVMMPLNEPGVIPAAITQDDERSCTPAGWFSRPLRVDLGMTMESRETVGNSRFSLIAHELRSGDRVQKSSQAIMRFPSSSLRNCPQIENLALREDIASIAAWSTRPSSAKSPGSTARRAAQPAELPAGYTPSQVEGDGSRVGHPAEGQMGSE